MRALRSGLILAWGVLLAMGGLARPAWAQDDEQTLIGGDVDFGGFGGPVLKVSSLAGGAEVLTGGRGGWIINFHAEHTLVLGGGGYGLATGIQGRTPDGVGTRTVDMGYGGVDIEYVNRTKQLVHFSVQTLIGAGGLSDRDDGRLDSDPDPFFVAEPQANLILNVTHFFRIGMGVSYRWVSGARYAGLDDTDLSGVAGVLTFKFGNF